MPAIGCLAAFVLIVLGAAVGGLVGGTTWAYWGGFAGLAIGLVVILLGLRWFQGVRSRLG